jgi:hypothetical protein
MRTLLVLVALAITTWTVPAWAGGCSSESCSLDPGDALGLAEFDELIARWQTERIGDPTLSLETLLFHGERTRALLATLPLDALDDAHRDFLDRELARDSVTVEMRLIDATGRVRGEAGGYDLPLVRGNRLAFEGTGDLGFLVTGGKVKRVGLDHLWSRW